MSAEPALWILLRRARCALVLPALGDFAPAILGSNLPQTNRRTIRGRLRRYHKGRNHSFPRALLVLVQSSSAPHSLPAIRGARPPMEMISVPGRLAQHIPTPLPWVNESAVGSFGSAIRNTRRHQTKKALPLVVKDRRNLNRPNAKVCDAP